MSNLQTQYFKLDFQKVDQHTGGKWLIHGTKRRKDNQLQAWNYPVKYPSREYKHDIKEYKGNMLNPILIWYGRRVIIKPWELKMIPKKYQSTTTIFVQVNSAYVFHFISV